MVDIIQEPLAAPVRPRVRDILRERPAIALALADAILLFIVEALANPLASLLAGQSPGSSTPPGAFIPAVLLIALLGLDGAYRPAVIARPGRMIRRIAKVWLLVQLFVLTTAYTARLDPAALDPHFLVLAAVAPVALLPQRLFFAWLASHAAAADLPLELQSARLGATDRLVKRGFDLAIATLLLAFFSPLMILVGATIRATSSGPVLFRQTRIGRDGQPFTILKFRTMTVQENGSSVLQATRQDPRVTRLGQFLRVSSIDELPQLFNVVSGEMSLVGPRPHAAAHDEAFANHIPGYRLRQAVKPGMTGLAQVSGARGEIISQTAIERRVALDLDYIERWSLWLDFWIIFRTFAAVLRATNAY